MSNKKRKKKKIGEIENIIYAEWILTTAGT